VIPPGFHWGFYLSEQHGPVLYASGPDFVDGELAPLEAVRWVAWRLAAKAWRSVRSRAGEAPR
jgi:hypothetical protein